MEKSFDYDSTIERALNVLKKLDPVTPEDFPESSLYMDQVTTLMEKKLRNTLRNPGSDKVLTKTMINNYAKNELIPTPERKKYTKDHLYELLFIFYFKSFMSIDDVKTLLGPLSENFFEGNGKYGVDDIYSEMYNSMRGIRGRIREEMEGVKDVIGSKFEDAPEDERDYVRKFAFVCFLGYGLFVRKKIIESIIDDMTLEQELDEDE